MNAHTMNYTSELVEVIRRNMDEENRISIPALFLLSQKSRHEFVKTVCKHCFEGKIELIKNKEFNRLYVILNHEENIASNQNWFDQLEVILNLVLQMLEIDTWEEFHEVTLEKYKQHALFKFLSLSNCKLSDLKFLLNFLDKFFAEATSLTLRDFVTSKSEYIETWDLINQGLFNLQQQELLEIEIFEGTIYFQTSLNNRLVQLLKNKPIPIIKTKKRHDKGLYYNIDADRIESCKLFFNEEEKQFTELITKLLTAENASDLNISILLYGPPGTGKTEWVYQLAKMANAMIIQLNFSQIQSMWNGETEKRLHTIFDEYDKCKNATTRPVILLLNEADGLMNRRVNVHTSHDGFHNRSQTQLLELMENFDGILIATSNLPDSMDEAFHRRFLYKQKIGLPHAETRALILDDLKMNHYLPEQLRKKLIEIAWSPAEIKNIDKKLFQFSKIGDIDTATLESVIYADKLLQRNNKIGFK